MKTMNKQHAYNMKADTVDVSASVDTLNQATVTDLSEADIDSLVYMYQEEKMAMDIYDLFATEYDSQVFDKISDAESNHLSAVENILVENGVDISELTELDSGEYLDQNLQDMYNTLIEVGLVSYEDALNVGVSIEQADIADLEEYINMEDVNLTVVGVYQNLQNGNEHHLDAFTQALA